MRKSGLGEIEAWAGCPPRSASGKARPPGDLVIAAEVLALAQRLARREEERLAKLAAGMPLKPWLES